jgi:hypothetical protein
MQSPGENKHREYFLVSFVFLEPWWYHNNIKYQKSNIKYHGSEIED